MKKEGRSLGVTGRKCKRRTKVGKMRGGGARTSRKRACIEASWFAEDEDV
jgi:hypothetical protein